VLSAVVITHNEALNIQRCLQSLKFCDEIIVVDSQSSDATRSLAQTFTPHVHSRAWKGYSDQKNHATQLAQGDWVLSIDADEEVTEALREEIQLLLERSTPHAAFSMPRKTIHFGRWIRHGGWYPNRLVRLFKKNEGSWVGDELHERWESRGTIGELRHDLLHYSFADLADQVDRNNHYSSLGALRLQKQGAHFSCLKLLGKTLSKFLETYALKLGFLDGYPGFIISVSAAYSVFLKWAKLWELENIEKGIHRYD